MRSCITVPIAIIGVGLRLPGGVTDLTNLWSVLKDGRDCIGPIPKERWDVARFYHPNRTHNGTSVTLEAGLIEQIYDFDADFFGISPKEAESMDPQQRLLLELTWEALEDAGIVPSSLAGSDTAVVVGAASPDAGTIHADDLCATSPYSMTGTNLSIIANRISYIFNFHGPSFTLDTACSSSLYALHQACQILALDGAELAVAAGVNVLLAPYPFVGFSQAYMLSPEGRCKVFDAHGNGYVRSEGGGVLLLEPLDKALAKHRHIHAVIRAVACNSDGRTQGIALPSAEAQEKLLTDLYKSANCSPDSLAYLEAHGTGTVVGDPLEATAIGRALGCKRKKPLTIGSVKCNLGHLETASAMAGIMKSLAIFKERRVPRQIHVSELNPNIDFATLNLHVPLEEEALQGDFPLRIGVNSFGFGGANGHVLLEEAPKNEAQPKVQGLPPLFLSAKSEPSLAKLACQCAAYLSTHPHSLPYLANLLLRHRECLPYRLVAESSDLTQLKTALLAYGMEGKLGTQVVFGQAVENDRHNLGKTAFVFAGNGCHWLGMGRDLLAHPVFLAKVTEVSELFAELSGISLLDLLQNCSEQDLEKTENTQPLIFLIQVGLCAVLKSCGIVPDVVFGHSVGEVCAVWAAGILSLKDAVRVVFYRSLYQGKTRGLGKMAAAKLSLEELAELLASQKITDVELAGINAPNSLTLCGSEEGLRKVGQELAKRRLFFKLLPLDYAFHSQGMESIKQDLENSLQGLSPRPPQRIFISSVSNGSGTAALGRLTEDNFTADYWWLNIRRPVLFHAAAKEAISLGVRYFLEISPHAILQQYLRSALKAAGVQGWVSATMQRKSDNLHILQNFWKTAWLHGWPLEVENYVPKLPFMGSCGFPNYPWQKVTYRIAETPESQGYLGRSPVHPLLGWRKGQEQVFENELDLATKPWLADHKVGEAVFYPAAAYLEMSFACGRACYGNIPLELLNTAILRPVLLEEAQSMVLRTQLESSDGELRILGRPFMQDVPYVLYSKGRLRPSAAPLPPPFEFVQKPWLFGSEIEASELYAKTAMANMHYGPVFQAVVKVWRKGSSVLAKLATENYAELALPSERGMLIAPPLLDAGLQLIFLLLDEELLKIPAPRLPYWFDRCVLYQEGRPSFVTCSMERLSSRGLCCEIKYYDAKGGLLLALFGGRARTVARLGEKKATELYATSLVAMPSLLPSSVDLPWQQIISKAEEALAKLKAKSTYQYTLGEERPLVLGALHSLFSSSLSKLLPSNLPKELLNYLQQQTFLDDLPDFPTLWQSLILGKPSRSSLALLLLGLEAKLNTSDKIPLQELWQAYVRRAYGFYEEVLLESLSPLFEQTDPDKPLVMILAYADQAGLALRLRPFWPKASLWLTATCEDKLETLEVKAKGTWSLAEERLHLLTWDPEQSVAKAPQAEVILTGNGLASANDLLGTLSHIYESLLPGSLFGFFETAPNLFDNVLRGLEPSFWVPAADGGPSVARLLTADEWLKALKQVGFTDLKLLRPSVDEFQDETFIIFARRPTLTQSETLASLQNRPSNFRSFPQNLSKTPQNICLLAVQEESHNSLQEKFRDFLRQSTATIFAYSFSTCCYGQEDVLELKASLLQAEPETLFILPLWAKDAANFADALASSTKLLTFARAYEEAKKPALRLAIVSFGAIATSSCGSETRSALSAALGVMRVMRNELPSLDLRFIDLDLLPSSDSFNALLLELQNWSSEREVVLRGGKRYVLRSYPLAKPKATFESSLARLEIDDPGHLEQLSWHEVARPKLGAGEVLVKVEATGLNFRDVMWALNLLPEEALENGFSGPGLGIECAGHVCAVGSKVKDLEVGTRVICFGSHCFASEVVTKEEACVRVPKDWDAVSAATVPVTFFTAYYALSYLARLKKGDKVLIHGACGGVGLAAIQVAQGLGLELYVTAGSPLKRRFLQLLGLKHIYDSRSLSFRDEILADTGGSGLDCVLNSLAGEAIEAGLAVLKPFGRFLELGKSDYYADAPMRLRPFRNNIAYFGIDVDQLMQERPKLGQELFAEMMQGFLKGLYHPLPCTVFEAQEVESAFRYMQKSRQIGKVVITPPLAAKSRQNTSARLESSAVQVSYEGSYLITGGLAGFGLATARFLQELGAGALILVSRKGENAANQKDIAALRENNPACQIRTLACDVTDSAKLAGLLEQELRTLPPLKGVIHAAAVLDDALLSKMTKEKLGRVLSPKFAGALALHQLSLKYQLDFFVVYSSISALVGNPGQTNYVAANVAMEGLILARRAQGLPALALGWGAIKDTGMLTRDAETMKSLTAMTGLVPLDSRQALQALAKLPSNCPPLTYIFGADFRKLAALPLMRDQRCQPLVGEEFGPKEQGESLLTRLANLNEEECHDLILSEVTALIARILRTSVNNVRPATPLQEMGIDSLMGVELSLALEELLGGHPLQGAISANISAEGITSRILQSLNRNEESGEQLFLTEMAESHGLTLSGQLEAVAKEAMREKKAPLA